MKVPTALGPLALLVLALPLACVGHQKIGHAQPNWFRQQTPGGKTSDADRATHRLKYAQMQKDLVALTKSINEYEWKHVDIMQKFSDSVIKSQEETMPLEDKRKQLQEQLKEFATKNEALQQEMESNEATRTENVHAMHEASRKVKERLYDCIESNKKKWAASTQPFWVTTTEPADVEETEEGSAGAQGGQDGPAESSEEDGLVEDGPAESPEEGEQIEDGPVDSSEGDEQIQAVLPSQGHNAEEPVAEGSAGPVAGTWGMPLGHPGMPMGHPGMYQFPRQPKRSRPERAPSTTPLLVSTTDPVPVQGVRPDVLRKADEFGAGAVAHQKSWEEVEPQPQGCSSMETLAKKLQRAIEKYTRSREQLMKDHAQQVKRKSLLELEGRAVDEVIENLRTDIGTLEHQSTSAS